LESSAREPEVEGRRYCVREGRDSPVAGEVASIRNRANWTSFYKPMKTKGVSDANGDGPGEPSWSNSPTVGGAIATEATHSVGAISRSPNSVGAISRSRTRWERSPDRERSDDAPPECAPPTAPLIAMKWQNTNEPCSSTSGAVRLPVVVHAV